MMSPATSVAEVTESKETRVAKTGILVPVDGSPVALRAIPWADLLRLPGERVTLVHVLPPLERSPLETSGAARVEWEALRESIISGATCEFDHVIDQLPDSRRHFATLVAEGDPAETIHQRAVELDARLIVMTTRGRGAVGRWLYGSVADRMARFSTTPVLFIRVDEHNESPPPHLIRVVVPLDGSALAEAALPLAISLARQLQAPVHLVSVVDLTSLTPLVVSPGLGTPPPPIELFERALEDANEHARRTLNRAAETVRAAGLVASTTTVEGVPADAIEATTRAGDVIVMTSHGRGGLQRWLLGSVAEKLVREATAPVLLAPAVNRGAVRAVEMETTGRQAGTDVHHV